MCKKRINGPKSQAFTYFDGGLTQVILHRVSVPLYVKQCVARILSSWLSGHFSYEAL